MAAPELTLITRNDLDTIIDTETGRIALLVRSPAGTRGTIETGFTGVRDVTALMTGVTAGTITVARSGHTVTFTFEDVKVSAASNTLTNPAPANMPMFYPNAGVIATAMSQVNTLAVRVAITSTGILKMYNGSTTDIHNGVLTFTTTNAWGTTLPGVARGTGVVYL